jgi:hypothetical protein
VCTFILSKEGTGHEFTGSEISFEDYTYFDCKYPNSCINTSSTFHEMIVA